MILVRHGESTSDEDDLYGGWYDDDLTPRGNEQAKGLAQALKDSGVVISKIFVSPFKRAQQTAAVVSEVLGIEPITVEDLKESNRYGLMTGRPKADGKARYPEVVEAMATDDKVIFPEGESYEKFSARILSAFDKIIRENPEGNFLIVTHGGPIKCILREKLNLPQLTELGDCAFIKIDSSDGGFTIAESSGVKWPTV